MTMAVDPDKVESAYKWLVSRGAPRQESKMIATGNYRETQALANAREFLSAMGSDDPRQLLVLAGPTGVGKTIAAAYVLRYANPQPDFGTKWASDEGAKFRHVSVIVERLFGDADDKRERFEMRRCSTLVIDDVGAELKTDHFLAFFDALINDRYGSPGITVITTNLTSDQFNQRYGARGMDRLRGRGVWYDINIPSLRGNPAD